MFRNSNLGYLATCGAIYAFVTSCGLVTIYTVPKCNKQLVSDSKASRINSITVLTLPFKMPEADHLTADTASCPGRYELSSVPNILIYTKITIVFGSPKSL